MSVRPGWRVMRVDCSRAGFAEQSARVRRWEAKARCKVTHPEHGSVVVPCDSAFSAMLCAAEFWGLGADPDLSAMTVTDDGPGDGPVRIPKDIWIMKQRIKESEEREERNGRLL